MRIRSLLALLVAVLFLVAACGSDGGGDGNGDAANGDTEAADGSGDEGNGDTEAADGSGDGDGGDFDFGQGCLDLALSFGQAFSQGFQGGGDGDLSVSAEAFQAAADSAPDEISGDFETLAEAFTEYIDRLQDAGVDLDDPTSFAGADATAFQDAVEPLTSPEVEEAGDNIQAWTDANCE